MKNLFKNIMFKKISLATLAMVLVVGGFLVFSTVKAEAAITEISTVSPAGGEVLSGTQNITWDEIGDTSTVSIVYTTNNWSSSILIAEGIAAGTKTYSWNTAPLADGTTYLVKVYRTDNVGVYDESNSTFEIDNTKPTVSIGAPSSSLTKSGPITYTITYGGASGVTLASENITLNKTGTADGTIAITGSGTTERTVTVSSITGSGTLGITLAAGTATDGATPANSALGSGPSTTFTVDNTAPTATTATMASNNSDTALAKTGDVVTLTIVTNENTASPTVTIGGLAAVSAAGVDAQHWTATRTMSGAESEGALAFTLNFSDLAGNPATEVTVLTGGSAVTFDKTAPVISAATLTTNGLKKIADEITLTITSDAVGYQSGTITVNGVAVTNFTDAGGNAYTAKYTVVENNQNQASGATPISVVLVDDAGNSSEAFTAVTANTVSIDAVKPTIVSATIGSDPAGPGVSTITVVFSETMNTATDPTVKIIGLATNPYTVTKSSYTGSTWVGTFTVLDNNEAATATITVSGAKDSSENTMVANNTAGTFGVDTIAPVISNVNVDKTAYRATLDPTVVVTIIENNTANTVTVNGFSATETVTPGTWTYSLTHGGIIGRYSLSIDATDVTGNTVQQLATSYDVIADTDTTAPVVSSIVVTPAQTTASVAFTSGEAGNMKVGYGLTLTHGNMTSYSSMISGANTIVVTGLSCGTTYHYSVYGKDSSNNESTSTDATFATSACTEPTEISVTNTSLVKRVATKNGLHDSGWKWIIDVTVPTSQTTLKMSFDNLTGAGTILAHDNIRFYSTESSDHTSSSPIVISTPGAGTAWSDTMTLNADRDTATSGRQIQITIQAAVPSDSIDGAYSASYDIQNPAL